MTTPNKEKLIEKFHTLVLEHGQRWTTIAEQLNQAGISTLKGLPWTGNNARLFYRPYRNKDERPATKQLPNNYPSLPEWLDDGALEDLRRMLEHWRAQGETVVRESRPLFKGPRRNSGIHCSEEILTRAMEKLKTDKTRTGGSLSLLVELLLWQYIGSPEDLLES
jgi:hypothetical protein